MPQTPPPAIDEAMSQGDQVPNVKTTPKEGLLHALFAIHQGGPVDKAIGEAHARRQAEAELHQRNMNTIAAKLHYDEKMSKDPSSATTVMEGGVTPGSGYTPLTEDEKTKLRHQYDIAEQLFNKAAGVDKGTKAHAGAISTVLRHIVHRGAGQPQKQGGPTPPPTDGGSGTTTGGGGTPQQGTPLDSSKPTPPPSGPSDAAMLPFERADIVQRTKDDAEFGMYKREQELLYKLKTDEDAAKAKAQADAKAANPTGRPVMGPATSVRNARILASQGKQFLDDQGNPIDLTSLPDTMGLKFIAWGGKHYYEPFSPNSKVITVGGETFGISPMDVEALGQDAGGLPPAGTDLGAHNIPSTTATTDPATRQTTVAKRTPTITGAKGRVTSGTPQGTAPAATPATPQARKPSPPPTGAAETGSGGKSTTKLKSSDPPPTQEDGTIPDTYPYASPQVIEGANQLIQDRDVDKIPTKTRELSAALARRTGWFQGKWTPQDESRMLQAKTFLEKLRDSDALKVLDSSAWNRFWVGKAGEQRHKGTGLLGAPSADVENYIIAQSAKGLKPEEAEFNRLFNQASGTVAGLSTLTRAGRATNAQVDTIRTELPNVFNAKDSKDAKARIANLLKEIENAHQMGVKGKGKGLTAPPGSSTSDIDNEIMKAVAAAKGKN